MEAIGITNNPTNSTSNSNNNSPTVAVVAAKRAPAAVFAAAVEAAAVEARMLPRQSTTVAVAAAASRRQVCQPYHIKVVAVAAAPDNFSHHISLHKLRYLRPQKAAAAVAVVAGAVVSNAIRQSRASVCHRRWHSHRFRLAYRWERSLHHLRRPECMRDRIISRSWATTNTTSTRQWPTASRLSCRRRQRPWWAAHRSCSHRIYRRCKHRHSHRNSNRIPRRLIEQRQPQRPLARRRHPALRPLSQAVHEGRRHLQCTIARRTSSP